MGCINPPLRPSKITGASQSGTPRFDRLKFSYTLSRFIRDPGSRKHDDGWPWSEAAKNNETDCYTDTIRSWPSQPLATMIHFPPENFVTLTIIYLRQRSLILGTLCLPTRHPLRLTPNIYCLWLAATWMHDLTTSVGWGCEERQGGVEQQAAAGCEKDKEKVSVERGKL